MRNGCFPVLMVLALALLPVRGETRNWTNSEGAQVRAELVKVEGGNVTLRLANGKLATVALATLSEADRAFIEQQAAQPVAAEAKPAVDPKRKARWYDKLDRSKREAAETGLPILLLFTGTSWCPYCVKLENEVFAKKEFQTFANQNLVLTKLEFGGGGSGSRKDTELAKEFGVKGYPTYFLLDAEGKQLARGGYHGGISPESFAAWVRKASGR